MRFLLSFCLIFCAAGVSQAIVIDDFTSAAGQETTADAPGGGATSSTSVGLTGSAFTARTVEVTAGTAGSTASVDFLTNDSLNLVVGSSGGGGGLGGLADGDFSIQYTGGPVDLLDGDSSSAGHYLFIDIDNNAPTNDISASLVISGTAVPVATLVTPGFIGTLAIPLSSLGSVAELSAATEFELLIGMSESASINISKVYTGTPEPTTLLTWLAVGAIGMVTCSRQNVVRGLLS